MLADTQTHTQTDRQTNRNIPFPYRGGEKIQNYGMFNAARTEWSKQKNVEKRSNDTQQHAVDNSTNTYTNT